MSPPSFGHFTPVGIERVPRHFGKVLHPRNSPERPRRTTIILPHSGHGKLVNTGGTRSPWAGRVDLHDLGRFSHATKGPKSPPFATSLPPHNGHFSFTSAERSCVS